jgi:hypothetical protein
MRPSWAAIVPASPFLLLVAALGCGRGGNRQLQSIAANASGMIQFQISATGTFTASPASVNPLPVSWYVIPAGEDPPFSYSLTSQPFTTGCQTGSQVIALAPTNPGAATTGPIPTQVFEDLVTNHTTRSEGGFVVSQPLGIPCP